MFLNFYFWSPCLRCEMYFKYIPDAKLKEELKYAINSQSMLIINTNKLMIFYMNLNLCVQLQCRII